MGKFGLRAKIIVATSIFMVVSNLLLGAVLMHQSRRAMKTLIDERMLDVVNTAAAMLDGDVLDRLTAEDEGTPEYQKVRDMLVCFRDNINLKYIYYVRDEGNKHFTFGIDSDPVSPGEFGSPVVYTDALYQASLGHPSVDEEPYEDEWGRFYSAYSPVFNSSGKVAGVVTTDFEAAWYERQLNQNATTIVIACLLFVLSGMLLTMALTRQYSQRIVMINRNLNDLTDDIISLTGESSGGNYEDSRINLQDNSMMQIDKTISRLKANLREHIGHANTLANSMITAMASDYRCVYHINLDENDGVCYRADPNDKEQTPEGIHFPYLERFTLYANTKVAEGYREGFLRFIEPDSIREALSHQPLIAYRYLVKRDGREYYEMIRMAGVRRAEERDDHLIHAVGLGFSVIDEEMREAMAKNETLAQALSMAEEANLAKTSFLSNMSHEIRTPMNAIIGLDNLALKDDTLNEQTRDYLEKIGGSAHHLLELINDILDMSRIESGRIVLRKEEFSFRTMLEQINTMVMSQCSDKGLTYQCSILNHVDDYYIGDDTRLKEVLINILSNAVKFTKKDGSITMTVERTAVFEDQSTLKFCIRDTGIGMDAEYIPKIFDPFSQEDGSRKNKYGSTGLGMAITRSIVEMMNGTIHVESEKGVGSEFTVIVTLKNCERQENMAEGAVDRNKMRVLVVDDDAIAAEHARLILDESGIRTDVCEGGQEALKMFDIMHTKHEPYNLVILAWKMPGMDGLETTRLLRERCGRDTTVILLASNSFDDVQEEACDAGVDGFLTKPLFATNVLQEFEHAARRNSLNLFEEKKRADITGRRILLAEDVEINAEIMMDVLEMEEVGADHAENGRIAVEMFKEKPVGTYDAILMDIRMPEMDGLEAASCIRALPRPDAKLIPIIALTANAFDEDVQLSLQAGMNAHLSKPVEPDHLFETLEELIYEAEEAYKAM